MQKQFSVADVISVCNVSDVSNTQHNIVFTNVRTYFRHTGQVRHKNFFFVKKITLKFDRKSVCRQQL